MPRRSMVIRDLCAVFSLAHDNRTLSLFPNPITQQMEHGFSQTSRDAHHYFSCSMPSGVHNRFKSYVAYRFGWLSAQTFPAMATDLP